MKTQTRPRIALVTGGARRIGAHIVHALHQAHWRVIIHYWQSKEAACALADELNQKRPRSAHCLQADLRDIAMYSHWLNPLLDSWGHLDLLVNNASIFLPTDISTCTTKHFDDLLDCNVKAPLFLAQSARRYLHHSQGMIINMADIHGLLPLKRYSIYSLSKAALIMMTKTLAREWAPDIRVNAIAPGPIIWPEGNNALDISAQRHIVDKTLMQALPSAQDVANSVLYMTEQRAMTGSVLTLDSGRLLRT